MQIYIGCSINKPEEKSEPKSWIKDNVIGILGIAIAIGSIIIEILLAHHVI